MNGHQVADPEASALESQTIFKEKTAGITHEKEENKLKMLKNMVF